ncbi:MAG TPA: ArsC/Spx/MgsR family protein [Bacteroidia bacterium]|nr:ArsC/Spx/MgsR family protein [Bacteroidia bacterium]
MLKVYFKNNCSTCRTALAMMKDNTKEKVETVEYLVDTPSEEEIKDILKMLGMKAFQLVRAKESLYHEKYAGKKISNAQWIKILHRNPILIERPIIVKEGKAIIGRPIERIIEFIGK